MQVDVVTLPLAGDRSELDTAPLEAALADRTVEAVDHHLFEYQGAPHLAFVIQYTPAEPSRRRSYERIRWEDRLAPDDLRVFDALRAWRNGRAVEEATPPWRVIVNRTLAGIAARRPSDAEELLAVPGIGPVTHARYGAALLAQIAALDAAANAPATPPPGPEGGAPET